MLCYETVNFGSHEFKVHVRQGQICKHGGNIILAGVWTNFVARHFTLVVVTEFLHAVQVRYIRSTIFGIYYCLIVGLKVLAMTLRSSARASRCAIGRWLGYTSASTLDSCCRYRVKLNKQSTRFSDL